MSNICRDNFDSLLPPGEIFSPYDDSDLDLLYEALNENALDVYNFLSQLSDLRNPLKTQLLNELEKEYGLSTQSTLTDAQRRLRLSSRMFSQDSPGTPESLQNALQAAGFDAYVYQNDPATDPALFTTANFQVTVGDPDYAFCGDPECYCGKFGADYLVNGDQYTQRPAYLGVGDSENGFCGDPNCVCGYYEELIRDPILYPSPTTGWPLVFFVGGDTVTRNQVTQQITDVKNADIPTQRRAEFKSIILKYKPLFTWAIIFVNYT